MAECTCLSHVWCELLQEVGGKSSSYIDSALHRYLPVVLFSTSAIFNTLGLTQLLLLPTSCHNISFLSQAQLEPLKTRKSFREGSPNPNNSL